MAARQSLCYRPHMSWAAFWIVLDGDMGEEDWTFMLGIWFA
jgi:hypothetical protein